MHTTNKIYNLIICFWNLNFVLWFEIRCPTLLDMCVNPVQFNAMDWHSWQYISTIRNISPIWGREDYYTLMTFLSSCQICTIFQLTMPLVCYNFDFVLEYDVHWIVCQMFLLI
jgi:hypothetical protein